MGEYQPVGLTALKRLGMYQSEQRTLSISGMVWPCAAEAAIR